MRLGVVVRYSLQAMEVAAILVVTAEILPSEAGGRNAPSIPIGGRRAPIETWHGLTSFFQHGISAERRSVHNLRYTLKPELSDM